MEAVNPNIRGPLVEGDQVIIGLRDRSNGQVGLLATTGGPSLLGEDGGNSAGNLQFEAFAGNSTFLELETGGNPNIPIFTIHYFGDPAVENTQTTSNNNRNPIVFFTLENSKVLCRTTGTKFCIGMTPDPSIGYDFVGLNASRFASQNDGAAANPPVFSFGNPTPFLIDPNVAQSWWPKNGYLAIVSTPYTFRPFLDNNIQNNNINVINNNLTPPDTVTTSNIISGTNLEIFLLPASYFPSSSSQGSATSMQCTECQRLSGLTAIANSICAFADQNNVRDLVPSGITDNCSEECSQGFTLVADCKEGVRYPYCTKSQGRCDGNCKSTCATEGPFQIVTDVCAYDTQTNSYRCVTPNPGEQTQEEALGVSLREPTGITFESEAFILVIVLLALFFLLVFYVLGKWSDLYKNQSRN